MSTMTSQRETWAPIRPPPSITLRYWIAVVVVRAEEEEDEEEGVAVVTSYVAWSV
jgi:hypothetical protein